MISSNKSKSELLREEGNKAYKSALNLTPGVLKEIRLEKCVKSYQNAINEAINGSELSSAYKNIAYAQFELAKFYNIKRDEKMENYYMSEMIKNFSCALKNGTESSKPQSWIDLLKAKSLNSIEEYKTLLTAYKHDTQVKMLHSLIQISPEYLKPYIHFLICECYHRHSVLTLQENFKLSVHLIKECYFYYQECKRLLKSMSKSDNILQSTKKLNQEKLNDLIDSVIMQECVSEAHQQKYIADNLYDQAINTSEDLNIELIWDALDNYKAAILKSREKDIEVEAECLCKIATIYEKVLGMRTNAKACYYKCLELVESMKPRTFTNCSWFIKCNQAVQRYQQEVLDKEEREKEEKRKKVIDKIEPDLKILNENFKKKSKVDFVEFVYKKYPPKNKEHRLDSSLLTTDLMKVVKRALTHYHTDRNSEDQYGLEWFFICEEISKLLSNCYENFKSATPSPEPDILNF